MALTQERSHTKPSGGLLRRYRGKRLAALARAATLTKLGKQVKKKIRAIGGNTKPRLFSEESANVYDPKSKSYKKAKIITIVESPANRHYVRRNIMTKGTVIETELGKAKITSRPGQHGVINAVLV